MSWGESAAGLAEPPAWLGWQWPAVTVLGRLSPTPPPAAVLCRAALPSHVLTLAAAPGGRPGHLTPEQRFPCCFPHAHAQAEGPSPRQSDPGQARPPAPGSSPRPLSRVWGPGRRAECGSGPWLPTAGETGLRSLSDRDAQAEQLAQPGEPAARSGLTPSCLGPGVFIFPVPHRLARAARCPFAGRAGAPRKPSTPQLPFFVARLSLLFSTATVSPRPVREAGPLHLLPSSA